MEDVTLLHFSSLKTELNQHYSYMTTQNKNWTESILQLQHRMKSERNQNYSYNTEQNLNWISITTQNENWTQ